MKPTKWGFKAFLLCEAETGYCLKYTFFTGKGQEQLKTKIICLNLLEGFSDSNYHVFMDNFYTSLPLFAELKQKGISSTGTIRMTKRGLPTKLISKESISKNKGIQFLIYSVFTLCLFYDKKLVRLIFMYYKTILAKRKDMNAEKLD